MYKRRKYNDGLKELAKSVHGKAKSLVADVRDLLKSSDDPKRKSMLKKIEVALASMASASLLIFTAKSAKEALEAAHSFHTRKNIIDELFDRYLYPAQSSEALQGVVERAKNRLFKKKAKLFLGLCGTLASAITAFAVGMKKGSNESYEANYEANYESKKDSMYKRRRHNDGLKAFIKQVTNELNKLQRKLQAFSSENPSIAKLIRIDAKIKKILADVMTGVVSVGTVAESLRVLSNSLRGEKLNSGDAKSVLFMANVALIMRLSSKINKYIATSFTPNSYEADYESKKDSMYRTRKSDKIAKSLRHNDGIRDVAKTLIGKIKVFIDKYKNLKPAGKAIFLLNKIVQALAAFYTAKSIYEMKRELSLISKYKKSLGSPTILTPTGELGNKDVVFTNGLKAIVGLVATFISLSKDKIILEGLPDGYEYEAEEK